MPGSKKRDQQHFALSLPRQFNEIIAGTKEAAK
jgi:hypothetical protein